MPTNNILVTSMHALPLVLSIRQWNPKLEIRAIESFGGHQIRQVTTQLFSIVRQKKDASFLIPWKNDWNELLFDLMTILLEEETIFQFILGSGVHWNVQQLSRIWNLAAETPTWMNDIEVIKKALDTEWTRKLAIQCGLHAITPLKSTTHDENTIEKHEETANLACLSSFFREYDKIKCQNQHESQKLDVKQQHYWKNMIMDVHQKNDRFLRVHLLSSDTSHYLLGVTEDVHGSRINEAFTLRLNGLQWIPKMATIHDPHSRVDIIADDMFLESLFRFSERIGLKGLYSIEFVTSHQKKTRIKPSDLKFHGLNPFPSEETWLLQNSFKKNILQAHVNCFEGGEIEDFQHETNRSISFVNLNSAHPFHFRVEEWKDLNFFERPVNDVTIPQGIHWGTVVVEGWRVNDLIEKIRVYMTPPLSR